MTRSFPRQLVLASLSSLIVFTNVVLAEVSRSDPEGATEVLQLNEQAEAKTFMISTANPHASQAGYEVLRKGGSAVDAAIAAQMVLNLTEPQSSGIGGGAFLLHFDQSTGELTTYDGRETAPAAVTPTHFLDADGKFIGWRETFDSGRATGVPGVLKMLELAHQRHGKLSWSELFESAIELSEEGFDVSPRLAGLLSQGGPRLLAFPDTRAYFFREQEPLAVGFRLKNPQFAESLRQIAEQGTKVFYEGSIGEEIIARVNKAASTSDATGYAGITMDDLRSYQPVEREAICGTYRGNKVCGMRPPSSGGATVLQILGMLERFDLKAMGPQSAEALHLYAEANRWAFADRNYYLGDPAFVSAPLEDLVSSGYLATRSGQLDGARVAKHTAVHGTPGEEVSLSPDTASKGDDTTHLSVIDAEGNAVALTSSIETAFGSRLMAGGFLLNNQLTDFSFYPEKDGRPVANGPAAGKRPLSSMSPTMVFRPDGSLYMIIGSPGGKRIISFVAKTIVAHIDWGLNIQEAIDMPHVTNLNGETDLESSPAMFEMQDELAARGHKVRVRSMPSGLHGIVIEEDRLLGGADSRREGLVLGD